MPVPQKVQLALVAAPVDADQVPAGQSEHEGALLVLLKEPGRHAEQLRAVKLAKVPGGQ